MYEEELPGIGYVLTFVVLLGITLVWGKYWMKRRKLREFAEKVAGPKGLPIIGSAMDQDIWKKLYNEFGNEKIVKIWRGTELIVFLRDPADIERLLKSTEMIDHSSGYQCYKPWLYGGLLTVDGDRWRHQRRAIGPLFQVDNLKTFLPIIIDHSQKLIDQLDKEVGKEFDCYNSLCSTSFDILLECVTDVKKQEDPGAQQYEKSAIALREIFTMKLKSYWLRFDSIFAFTKYNKQQKSHLKNVHDFSGKMHTKHEDIFIKNGSILSGLYRKLDEESSEQNLDENKKNQGYLKKFPLAQHLLEAAQGGVVMVPYEIQNNIDTMLCKGHETTASVCSFFLCTMADRQDIQDLVFEELVRELGDKDGDITYEDVSRLKYLELCVMETLRLFPPIPVFARRIQQDLHLASMDEPIPAECTVVIDAYKMHRDPKLYQNPHQFNPDHFLPARCAKRHYYSFVPFSAGARCCVGRRLAMLEAKIILAKILRKFKVLPGKKAEDWKIESNVTLNKMDGFLVKIERRK